MGLPLQFDPGKRYRLVISFDDADSVVSGFQLLGMVREHRDWMQVPVIVVSAKVLEEDIVQALDLGANDYVTKPYRPKELLARVRRLIADREAMALG